MRGSPFFSALSSVCCASATMFMPFVRVGGMRVVIIIAFFRERHNDICIFACRIIQLGKPVFRRYTGRVRFSLAAGAGLRTDLSAMNIPAECQDPADAA